MAARTRREAANPTAHHGGKRDIEELDNTPVSIPVGGQLPTPLPELIARMVANEIASIENQELESFEEGDDFDDPEEDGLLDMSPYTFDDVAPEDETLILDEPLEMPFQELEKKYLAAKAERDAASGDNNDPEGDPAVAEG